MDNFVQYLQAFLPNELTDEGIVIEVNDEHPLKAHFPILLTDDGIEKITEVRDVHF